MLEITSEKDEFEFTIDSGVARIQKSFLKDGSNIFADLTAAQGDTRPFTPYIIDQSQYMSAKENTAYDSSSHCLQAYSKPKTTIEHQQPNTTALGRLIDCTLSKFRDRSQNELNKTRNAFPEFGSQCFPEPRKSEGWAHNLGDIYFFTLGEAGGVYDSMKVVPVLISTAYGIGAVIETNENNTTTDLLNRESRLIKNRFFSSILSLQKQGKIDSALDVLYKSIPNLLFEEKYSIINDILLDTFLSHLNDDLQLGLLVVTKPWKNKLPLRMRFYTQVRSNFLRSKKPETVDKILKGLI